MGKLVVTIGVGDQQGRQFEDLEVTVDIGSTFTAVPRALLQRLGVPVRRSARSRLADGSSVPVDIGWTVVRLEDQTFATQVILAEENQPSLLGVVTLEDALLAVDPVGQRLVPVEADQTCSSSTSCLLQHCGTSQGSASKWPGGASTTGPTPIAAGPWSGRKRSTPTPVCWGCPPNTATSPAQGSE